MGKHFVTKHGVHELKRMIEAAAADLLDLPRPGLWFCVEHVEVFGQPPARFQVWAKLHFLPEGDPFYLGDSCVFCHPDAIRNVSEHVTRALRLTQPVSVEFVGGVREIGADGIRFVNYRAEARHPAGT